MKINVIYNSWPKMSLATMMALLLIFTDSHTSRHSGIALAHRINTGSPFEFKIQIRRENFEEDDGSDSQQKDAEADNSEDSSDANKQASPENQ